MFPKFRGTTELMQADETVTISRMDYDSVACGNMVRKNFFSNMVFLYESNTQAQIAGGIPYAS